MMGYLNRATLLLFSTLAFGAVPVGAQDTVSEKQAIRLSPALLELLREEMRAVLSGVQSLPAGIAAADWKQVADTGAQISSSYILAQKLTPAQTTELGTALPEHFKRLDADFHHEAEKLAVAATRHDAQLTAFHFYRLIDACTSCHALYAPSRFPGFAPVTEHTHDH